MQDSGKKRIDRLVGEILESYREYPQTCSIDRKHRLNNEIIIDLLEKIRCIVFPGYFEAKNLNQDTIEYHVGELLEDVQYRLTKQVEKALYHRAEPPASRTRRRKRSSRRSWSVFRRCGRFSSRTCRRHTTATRRRSIQRK